MNKRIQQHIRSLSNADLIEYLNAPPDTYLPEAIAFARQEFDGRNLSAEQVHAAEEEIAAREAQKIADANAPLDSAWEGFGLSNHFGMLAAWFTFKRTGRQRMAREILHMWLAGLVFWGFVTIGLALLYFFVLAPKS